MFWKAKFARRNDSNEKLKNDKEEAFWEQLNDVEKVAFSNVGDDHPIKFGDNWKDLTLRRAGKYPVDNHIRSDAELQIEKSMGKRISLHEDQVPLNEVLQKIAALANFSIYIDDQGLEEDAVFTDTPVSINVESITVKSALNLLLERHDLAYMIQDEVLKITSRIRQQGDMVTRTYSVADLVVPIPSLATADPSDGMGTPLAMANGMNSLGTGQYSVPPSAALGQAFPQIGANGNPGAMGVNGSNPRMSAQVARNADFDSLSDLIISTISPETWDCGRRTGFGPPL